MHPARIGKYEVLEFLGGGMSHVYKARDTLIGRTVAIKVLTELGAASEDMRARFFREAQIAGNVTHDNVVRVYDFGDDAGRLFMVMEFLDGENLTSMIRNDRAGSVSDRIQIALQIARGMEYVHSLGIIHRDLKPDNVYITANGVAKLVDFGIAKTGATSMTRTGYTLGSPSYMAPEQVRGKEVSRSSDVYAFGMLLYELMTGIRPIEGESIERVFWQILNDPLDLEPLAAAGAPPDLVALIRRCTEKDAANRPQTFAEVSQRLEAISHGAASGARAAAAAATHTIAPRPAIAPAPPAPAPAAPDPDPPAVEQPLKTRPRSRAAVVIMAAVLIAAVLGSVYVWMRLSTPQHARIGIAAKSRPSQTPLAPKLSLPSGDMILVPAGAFLFGKAKETRSTSAFYIDRAEVTNAAYRAFLQATGHVPPSGIESARPEFPVVNVTLQDARDFAKWAGKRLPSAVEWEKAARGTDGRVYTWGDTADPHLAGVRGGLGLTAADTEIAGGPFGTVQMTGNVWELIDEPATPSAGALRAFASRLSPRPTADEPWCMIRGGSYLDPLYPVYEFGLIPARFRSKDIGFRCVRDVK